MADWIKMRSSLLTNPKVVRMARVLLQDPEFMEWLCPGMGVTRDETVTKRHVPVVTRIVVGALLPTWSAVNDTAGRDGVVRHAASRDIDETAGVPGFGKALLAVEWLKELPDGHGVQFINFDEHNSPQKERSLTAKSPAERQKEYRERKAREAAERNARDAESDVARDVTVTQQRDDREEKSRGEKKRKKGAKAPSSAPVPTWMQRLIDLYHEVLPELPGVEVMNHARSQAMTDFRDWVMNSKRKDGSRRATNDEEFLTWSREYFERARQNDFIMGRTPRSPEHRNWKPSIQWLLSSAGMEKVIEQTEASA
jgi:hypothetical protein